jgi:hypothetical protein
MEILFIAIVQSLPIIAVAFFTQNKEMTIAAGILMLIVAVSIGKIDYLLVDIAFLVISGMIASSFINQNKQENSLLVKEKNKIKANKRIEIYNNFVDFLRYIFALVMIFIFSFDFVTDYLEQNNIQEPSPRLLLIITAILVIGGFKYFMFKK